MKARSSSLDIQRPLIEDWRSEAAGVMKFEIGEIQTPRLTPPAQNHPPARALPAPRGRPLYLFRFASLSTEAQKSAMAGQREGWGLGFAHLQDQRRVSSSLDFLGSIHPSFRNWKTIISRKENKGLLRSKRKKDSWREGSVLLIVSLVVARGKP
jgi:hypothetical protein